MPDYYAQAVLASTTGNTRDANVNTFAVGGIPAMDLPTATTWVNAIVTFYNSCANALALLGRAQTGHMFKIYEMTAARPNYPKFELPFILASAPSAVEMPNEVALAISYVNTEATTIARARRRGRIYISGFAESVNTAGRPTLTLVQDLANAYTAYANAVNAGMGGLDAGVWSRASDNVWPIQQVFSDNEWDTMRSRGGRATQRFTNVLA